MIKRDLRTIYSYENSPSTIFICMFTDFAAGKLGSYIEVIKGTLTVKRKDLNGVTTFVEKNYRYATPEEISVYLKEYPSMKSLLLDAEELFDTDIL